MLPKYKAYFSKLQIRLYLNKLYVVRYLNYGTTKYRELDLTFKRKQLIGNYDKNYILLHIKIIINYTLSCYHLLSALKTKAFNLKKIRINYLVIRHGKTY